MLNSKYHLLRIVIFLLVITIPSIITTAQFFLNGNNEIAKTFKNPKESLRHLKKYYADDFMKNSIFVDGYLKLNFLNENPIPNNVIRTEDNWYFLGNNYENTLADAFGDDKFTEIELNTINDNLNSIKKYLDSKNIKFYLVIAPNKNSVYKEKLPYALTQKETKLNQLKSYLNNHSKLDVIDPTKELISQKSNKSLLYYKTDSHWNTYGAFLAYNEVMRFIKKDFPLESEQIYNYKFINHNEIGDLTAMLKSHQTEKSFTLTKKSESFDNSTSLDPTLPYLRCINKSKDFKAIMFRDSFSNAWIPFFNETFGEVLYLKDYSISEQLIDKEKPDLIIVEIVERNLRALSAIKSPIKK